MAQTREGNRERPTRQDAEPARMRRIWAVAVCCALLAACGGGGGGDGGSGPSVPECASGESYASTFDGIQKVIFERRGCTQEACHGSAKQGGLELTAGAAYDNIYDVRALGSSLSRIEPGDEERSYLWLKVAAGTRPDQYAIAGSPMPNGLAPLSEDELELLRLWIYAGAPRDGNVNGSEALLAGCLPPPEPINIEPLDPPAAGEGFQLRMPEWELVAGDEFEGCFATYYDVTDQVPAEYRDPSGAMFRFGGSEVRQDPQSHHLFLYYPTGNFSPEGVDVRDPAFGSWTCRGGDRAAQACDPLDLASCGDGLCASELRQTLACIGYGPSSAGTTVLIGGAGQPVAKTDYAPGVFAQLPMKGVIYWNSHAFNLTTSSGTMHAALNYYFADDQRYTVQAIANFSAIFRPNALPYTKETYCNDQVVPRGAQLFNLATHTHKRGERTWVTLHDGTMIYENFSYSDPVQGKWDPPLLFDSPDPAERTLRYCGTYNNGVAADGSPDPDTVTRLSKVRQTAGDQIGGRCTPVACTAGKVGAACQGEDDDATCDSSPGAGDGECDACRITGGESTENEMFNLFGLYFVVPEGQETAAASPLDLATYSSLSPAERSLETEPVLPNGPGCMGHGAAASAMH